MRAFARVVLYSDRDGTSRMFRPGEHFFAAGTLPAGAAAFDAAVHGHWSAQRRPDPLVTLFLKA